LIVITCANSDRLIVRNELTSPLLHTEFYFAESIYDVPLTLGDRFYSSNYDSSNPPVTRWDCYAFDFIYSYELA